ncbi:hypothetical protein CFOL_v3_30840 [Cephalotus follicularis]|uniref:Uncharacterized protein n=1 Tax=Cephalotus follicularis TaxID=3775 RepID=A0A1Q3D4P6_CEPFO|nr:hypothetical protein CFOL_v3_30840 [Cephalotus follicularis]
MRNKYEDLTLASERRLRALYHVQGYHKQVGKAFNKKVKPRGIKVGDLVLKELNALVFDPRGKFKPNWIGLYILKKIMTRGAVWLMDLDGVKFHNPTNLDPLKKTMFGLLG